MLEEKNEAFVDVERSTLQYCALSIEGSTLYTPLYIFGHINITNTMLDVHMDITISFLHQQ